MSLNTAESIELPLLLLDPSGENPGALDVPAPERKPESSDDAMAGAVNRLFEQTKRIQPRLDELTEAFELLERAQSAVDPAFRPIRALRNHLSELAASFDFFRDFQSRIAEFAKTFGPMKDLHAQTMQVSENLQSELAKAIELLDPARKLADRVGHLARLLQQADELQTAFAQLYSGFRIPDSDV